MKKIKLIAAMAAATMTLSSMAALPFSVSATQESSSQGLLYRYTFYAPSNTYLVKVNANAEYNPYDTKFYNYGNTCLGINFINGSFSASSADVSDTQSILCINYNNSSPNEQPGYIGFVDFISKHSHLEFTVTSVKNDRGNNLTLDTISINCQLVGDVNVDDVVNIIDFNLLNKAIAGSYDLTEQGKINADINGDGKLDFQDTSELMKIIQGNL